MKKKVLSALLVASMTATMFAGCGEKKEETTTPAGNDTQAEAPAGDDAAAEEETVDYGSGEVKIWAAKESADLTKTLAEKFIADKGADYTVTVESVGEGDAATNMITDVQAGADIYAFAQDQLTRLVAAGALQQWNETGYDEWIKSANEAGAVEAAIVGDNIYAFPFTADNGYFLYYDKSVVTDPSSLEKIVEDCEAAG
ncbi:MAG: extracellular solute-binding protein, partial [Agathobacter sp.]|nr:extracellular solute-binding protein [Agathobacter sp.]